MAVGSEWLTVAKDVQVLCTQVPPKSLQQQKRDVQSIALVHGSKPWACTAGHTGFLPSRPQLLALGMLMGYEVKDPSSLRSGINSPQWRVI